MIGIQKWITQILCVQMTIISLAFGIQTPMVTCDPNTVGVQAATLSVQFTSEKPLPIYGFVKVVVPTQTSVINSSTINCAVSGWIDLDGQTCRSVDGNTLLFPIPQEIAAGFQNEFKFRNVFNSSPSTDATDSFEIIILSADENQVVEQQTTGIQMTDLVVAEMQDVTVTQVDDPQVGELSEVYFTVTTLNPIPAGGGIQIEMPKWNTMAPVALLDSYMVDYNVTTIEPSQDVGTNIQCSPKSHMDANLTCSVIIGLTTDTITVKGAFPNGRNGGQTFSLYVKQLRNPISTSPVSFTVRSYTAILEETEDNIVFQGLIDEKEASYKALYPADIDPSKSEIVATVKTVQEHTQYYVPFSVSVPVQEGCQVSIKLPDDFTLDAGKISKVWGWGIFGGKTQLNAEINEVQRTISIVDQCEKYAGPNVQSTIEISTLQNPSWVEETGSFQIQMMDQNSGLIAEVNKNITFTPVAGTVENISLKSVQKEIGDTTDVTLSFMLPHTLTVDSYILIQMPANLPGSCTLAGTKGFKQSIGCTEDTDTNTFKFFSPFHNDYTQPEQLEITFKDLTLPGSEQPISGISIESYQNNDGQSYLVDQFANDTYYFFTPQPVQFLYTSVEAGTTQTYTESSFRFTHIVANYIPSGSIIEIEIPKQIEVIDEEDVKNNLLGIENLSTSLKCDIIANQTEVSDYTVKITNAFNSGLNADETIEFVLNKGLRTPISIQTTDSFKIRITDKNGFIINYVYESVFITMQIGSNIGQLTVVPSEVVTGSMSEHSISFKAPVPLDDGFVLYYSIPSDCEAPMQRDLVCHGESPLQTDFPCKINGQRVTITLAKDRDIVTGDTITVHISTIKNPQSLKPSKPYRVTILNEQLFEVADQFSGAMGVTMLQSADIVNYGFHALDPRQGAKTTVTVEWINTQFYPKDMVIDIQYTTNQLLPMLPDVKCIYLQQSYADCKFSKNKITVSNILQSDQEPGQWISITLTDIYINVFQPLTTESWTLTTYLTDSDELYAIDKIPSGLTLTYDCTFPCQDCLTDSPELCTSCNTVQGHNILFEHKCYKECPDGTYFENFQCKPCSDQCLTCSATSGIQCTSCDPKSSHPFLDGNVCTDVCSFGFYGNYDTAKCEPCESPCESCYGTSTNCVSCFQDTVNKFAFPETNECLPECPIFYIAPVAENNNICVKCDDNCRTCKGSRDFCVSCQKPLLLNEYNNNCVEVCPSDVTVQNDFTESCEICDSSCKTCSGKVDFCTSCPENLSLVIDEGKCLLDCDTSDFKLVSVDGNCQGCSSSCEKCMGTPDKCISCDKNSKWKYFYNNKCVESCPEVDGYQYEPNEDNQCVIKGLICGFGYKVNVAGSGCELKAQVCENGFKLNFNKDGCIPGSPHWIPIPILTTAMILMLVAVVSKVKFKQTRLLTSWIAILSLIETIGIIVLAALANDIGILPVYICAMVALVFTYGINIFFVLIYSKQVSTDAAFKYYKSYYNRTAIAIAVISTMLNFSFFRTFYSKLFGKKQFDCTFQDVNIFFRPFQLASLSSLITVKLPLLVACILGCIYVDWGYQLLMTCMEMLIIEILIIALMIAEFFKLSKSVLETNKYYKINADKVSQQKVFKVKSGYMDEDDDDSGFTKMWLNGGPRKPRSQLQSADPYKERIRGLKEILSQIKVKQAVIESGQETVKEIDALHEEEIMNRQLRHCKSFRDLRLYDEGYQEMAADPDIQNFISAPSSPREKEMLHNDNFLGRMTDLKRVYKMRDQYDNCYHEARAPHLFPLRDTKLISVKVQTNILELLGVDDLLQSQAQDRRSRVSTDSERYIEETIDQQYTSNLISNVIDTIEGDITEQKRRRKRLSKERMAEIPDFEIQDIQGQFEINNAGHCMIIKTKDGKLNDKNGNRVNRRGYLIDADGNVISNKNEFIFYKQELDVDDEIPAPYCFDKKKQSLFKVEALSKFKQDKKYEKVIYQDDYIEKHYRRLRDGIDDSQADDTAENFEHTLDSQVIGSLKEADRSNNQVDEEDFISKLVAPMQAKSKAELIGNQKQQNRSNKQLDVEDLANNDGNAVQAVVNVDHLQGMNRHVSNNVISSNADDDHIQSMNSDANHGNKSSYGPKSKKSSQAYEESRMRPPSSNYKDLHFSQKMQTNPSKSNLSRHGNRDARSQPPMREQDLYYPAQGSENTKMYREDLKKIQKSLRDLQNDDEFIRKLQKFQQSIETKKARLMDEQAHGNRISQTLARRNLTSVYGKVRQKYNIQIRDGRSEANIFSHDNVKMISPTELTRPRVSSSNYNSKRRRQQPYDSTKLDELRQIYSNYRPDGQVELNRSSIEPYQRGAQMHVMDQSAPDFLNPSEQRLAKELDQKMSQFDEKDQQSMLNNSQLNNRSNLVENYMLASNNKQAATNSNRKSLDILSGKYL